MQDYVPKALGAVLAGVMAKLLSVIYAVLQAEA